MRGRILIVEDNWLTQRMLKQRLSKQGYEIVTAKDEQEFWHEAFERDIDLIILDACLKNRSGIDIYLNLVRFGFDREVPVIFVTGLISELAEENQNEALEDQLAAYLAKPIKFEKLIQEIERLLKLRAKALSLRGYFHEEKDTSRR